MASSIIETPLSPGSTLTHLTLVARSTDGSVWSVGEDANHRAAIQRTDAPGLSTVEFTTASNASSIRELLTGKGGSIWAVVDDSGYGTNATLLKLTADYVVTIPISTPVDSATIDTDGDVWLHSRANLGNVGWTTLREYDHGTGVPSGVTLTHEGAWLTDVTAASDGSFWFAQDNLSVARLAPDGSFATYADGLYRTTSLAAGADGRVWVGGRDAANRPILASVSPGGQVDRIGLGHDISSAYDIFPGGLASAPDGSVWFYNDRSSLIGRATVDGKVTEVPIPTLSFYHTSITSDGGSGVYYTDTNTNTLSHLTTNAPDTGVSVRARSFSAVEGTLSSATTIATFTTPDASAFGFDFIARYQIDGQRPHNGVVLSDGNGGFVVRAGSTSEIHTPGPHFLTVTIIDAKHGNTIGSAASGFAVATFDDPAISVVGQTFSALAGANYTGSIARIDDPSPVAGTTTGTINWGDGSAESTWTNTPSTGHAYAAPGTYTVTITAKQNSQVVVGTSTANVLVAPVLNLTGTTAGFSAGRVGRARVATFTASPMVDPSLYLAGIKWGTNLVAGEIVAKGSSYEVYATINFANWGTVPLTVSVTPVGGEIATQVKLDALITPAPITASLIPIRTPDSGLWGGTVAGFTSFNTASKPSDYRATVSSSDGGSWTAQVLSDGHGGFFVYASHAFTQDGSLPVTVTIDNVGAGGAIANAATLIGTAKVALPIALDFVPSSISLGNSLQVWQGTAYPFVMATFRSNPEASVSNYTAKIDWADGTTTDAELFPQGDGVFFVQGAHAYANLSRPVARITLEGDGGLSGKQALDVPLVVTHPFNGLSNIRAVGASPLLNTTYKGSWASFTPPSTITTSPSDFVATIRWNDGSPDQLAQLVSDGAGGYAVKAPHVFTTGGAHTIGVSIQWADEAAEGSRDFRPIPVIVAASPIWINNAVFSGQTGTPVGGVVATFVDAKPNDVNKYSATIDWADGTTTEGRVSIYDGGFIVYGTHAYATAGTYANVVTIKNAGAVSGVTVGGITIKAASVGTPGGGGDNGGGPVGSPTVTSSVAQFFAKGASKLLLNYSDAIESAKALKRSRYKIIEAGKDGKLGTKDDRTVAMRSIAYDSKTRQVIIVPKGAFKRAAKFRVKIQDESTVTVVASR